MIIPDLAQELAYWKPRLKLSDWKITMAYVDDPVDPETGAPVWGLNTRETGSETASIQIRTPRSAADIPATMDTIIHELLHCLQAPACAPVMVEEKIVWTLSPLLTQLRMSDPTRAESLCKAMTRTKMSAPGTKAAKGNMDPAKLAELAMKAGAMVNLEGLPAEAKALLEELVTALAGGAAPESTATPVDPSAVQTKDDKAPPGPPMMGPAAKEDPMYKQVLAQFASDREAAVEGLLDTRPDLAVAQRTRFKAIGVKEGVAVLRADLATLAPAPKAAPAVVEKPVVLAKMGEEKPVRGGAGGEKIQSSGNLVIQTLFRVFNRDPQNDGVSVPDDGTALVSFSVVDAFAQVKAGALKARDEQRVKLAGGAR